MANAKSTKKSLLFSALSLMLCFAMLIGTTFAWFTDSVTSANNVIKSGNLDIELEYWNGEKWVDVKGKSDILTNTLWEPGVTEVAYLKVKNAGSLALKYQLGVNIASETAGVNAEGQSFLLSDYIMFGVVEGVNGETGAYANRDDAVADVTTAKKISAGYSKASSMLSGDEFYLALVVYMPTTVGNEANHNGTDVPEINLGISVVATQYTHEEDSFDKNYDAGTPWLGAIDTTWYNDTDTEFTLYTPEQLAGLVAIVEGTATTNTRASVKDNFKNKTIKLGSDIDLNNLPWTPIGSWENCFYGSFDGQNHTVYNLNVSNEGWAGLFGHVGRGYTGTISFKNVTVKGATVNSSRMAGVIVGQMYGNIENCHVEDATLVVVPNWTGSAYDNGDKVGAITGWLGDNGYNHFIRDCSATNVTVKAYRDVGGITGYIGTTSIVEDCEVTDASIIVDQKTNNYGTKDANAGAIVGRVYNTPVTIQNNTETNVTVANVSNGLKDAYENGATVKLPEGNFSLSSLSGYEGMTITGAADGSTVISSGSTGFGSNFGKDSAFENLTFSGSTNGVRWSYAQGGTSVFENCTFKGDSTYGFHIDESNGATFIFNNCTFVGFNAFAGDLTKVIFNNCTFLSNGNYGHTNIWSVAEFNNCTWGDKTSVGPGNNSGATLTFNGVEESYHHEFIGSAASLFAFANSVNAGGDAWKGQKVVLVADIDLENALWTPVGQTGATQFKGTFDGQGYTVSNLKIDSSAQTGKNYATGLFGWLNGAVVTNVNVDKATVTGNHYVGVIAGYMETSGCTISNCNVTNSTVTATHVNDDVCGDKIGVIVGYANNTGIKVENCSATDCTVVAGRDAGQIVGAAKTAYIVNCTATNVTVTADGSCTGANVREEVIGRVL